MKIIILIVFSYLLVYLFLLIPKRHEEFPSPCVNGESRYRGDLAFHCDHGKWRPR